MLDFNLLKNYPEIISGQTEKTRVEVEEISRTLKGVSLKLTATTQATDQITQKIGRAKVWQKSFQGRLKKTEKTLKRLKSLLASFQS